MQIAATGWINRQLTDAIRQNDRLPARRAGLAGQAAFVVRLRRRLAPIRTLRVTPSAKLRGESNQLAVPAKRQNA